MVYSTSMGVTPGVEPGIVRIEAQHPDNADIVRLAAIVEGRVVGTTVVVMAHGVAGISEVSARAQWRISSASSWWSAQTSQAPCAAAVPMWTSSAQGPPVKW
ncbi:hypothetical protein [Nonomuraea sp. NPDC049709]|uniref:hypothetical protein n=1 Tax=Nonomuraea sp. NPDC049709 TaxID=3154736 RepID=UPI0034288191